MNKQSIWTDDGLVLAKSREASVSNNLGGTHLAELNSKASSCSEKQAREIYLQVFVSGPRPFLILSGFHGSNPAICLGQSADT